MTAWVDSHCHLHLAGQDPAELLGRAAASGVAWLVCPGTDAAGSEEALRLAAAHPGVVFAAAGLHPHDASRWPQDGESIARLAARAVAVGECGLDFYRDLSPRRDQVAALQAQFALARDLDKPLILHCRDAFAELYDEVEAAGVGPRTVLHCWTGGADWTRRFAPLGVTFSFAGTITYPTGEATREAAAVAPPERTMVETDTPYLTPPPRRNAPNEPANVVAVGRALAEVWGVAPEEVARTTSATAARVFGVG
ncbi:MAG: hydrolase, TatD family [Acidobacteria bacterium]|nr:hydrolase, TatD family [Acidobacteriota bacterium]